MSAGPILVTGGTGQIGIELRRRGGTVVAPDRAELDICDGDAVAAVVASRRWAAVVNCAAYTAVDKAEGDVAAAWRTNALAPAILAEATARAAIPLIQLSTDYVFDGRKPGRCRPDDPVGPLGVYGASKLGGELAVRTANPTHVILRTAWVVSAHRANFVKTMLRLATERDVVAVVDDQLGCPTSAADIADAVLRIAAKLETGGNAAASGIHHFVNAGEASWCALARHVFAALARRGRRVPEVKAIATAYYPTPARRPANSRLDTRSTEAAFGIAPRPWQEAVDDILAELLDEDVAVAAGGAR